jgi:hypothetical protein
MTNIIVAMAMILGLGIMLRLNYNVYRIAEDKGSIAIVSVLETILFLGLAISKLMVG